MKFFKNASLPSKITMVTMLTTLATLLLTVAAISVLEVTEFRKSFLRELRSIAGIVGGNSVAALEFLDASTARKTLSALAEDPRILEAVLYNEQGIQFAAYSASHEPSQLPSKVPLRNTEHTSEDSITITRPIFHKSQKVGAISLKATTKQLSAQLIEYASITITISLAAFLAAFFISKRLRHFISNPIIRLSNTAIEVSQSGNYSLRVPKDSNDETGMLTEKFNEMLQEIEGTTQKLQASEDQLRLITDSLPVFISYVDKNQCFQFTNGAYRTRLRFTVEELKGMHIAAAMGEKLYQVIAPYVSRVLTGEPVQFECKAQFPEVGERYISSHYIPDFDGSGVRGFFSLVVDITERKQAEAEREQLLLSERSARSEAERASLIKDEFLTTLSHELRTPLNAIVGWSQLLSRGKRTDEQIHEGLAVIARNAKVQTQLIEDLLDLSRIISGKLLLDKRQLDMNQVVSSAIEAVTLSAQAKKIKISLMSDAEVTKVVGDSARLQQVVWNLLVNGVKFTPQGGSIKVSLTSSERKYVQVTVEDTGQGMSADFIPYAFERFRQGDASTTRKHGGLGIGLSIVKQLVELHGGSVGATSAGEGKGSSFYFRIAASEVPVSEAHELHRSASYSASLTGSKILVIDDEIEASEIIKQMLEERGAVVTSESSAEAGLYSLKRIRPDLVITDIGMPEFDGYDFIRWVRAINVEDGGATPIIACTAFAHAEDRRRTTLAGFQAHLTKPIDEDELMATVVRLIR